MVSSNTANSDAADSNGSSIARRQKMSVRVGASALGGNGLLSTRGVAGKYELLCGERPLVACLMSTALSLRCSHCWRWAAEGAKLRVCGGCKRAHFCSAACQQAAWRWDSHRAECVVVPDRSEESVRLAVRLLCGGGTAGRELADVGELLSDEQQRHFGELATVLAGRLAKSGMQANEALVRRVLMQLHCCAMRIPDPADGSALAAGLFATASAANHSCRPNAIVLFDEAGGLSLLAVRPIAEGEEVLISYVDSSLPSALRRFELFDTWRVADCRCAQCTGEAERGVPASPATLFDAFASFGNSADQASPATRERFLQFAAKETETARAQHSDADEQWKAAIEFAQKAAQLSASSHMPGLRFADMMYGYLCTRPALFPIGSYFWTAIVQRLALQAVKVGSGLPENEMLELLRRACLLNGLLVDALRHDRERGPLILGIHIINSRALLWEASYVADSQGRAAMNAVVVLAEKELSQVANLEKELFKHVSGMHGWQRDGLTLREQYEEMRAAMS